MLVVLGPPGSCVSSLSLPALLLFDALTPCLGLRTSQRLLDVPQDAGVRDAWLLRV